MKILVFFTAFACSGAFGSLFSSSSSSKNYSRLCDKDGPYLCNCPADDTSNVVDCAERKISELPPDINFPDYVSEVSFKKNHLTAVPSTIFSEGLRVKQLDISHNLISFLASNAFEGLENLENLDLSHNEIWSLSVDNFHGLRYLSTLNLAYNKLNQFFSDVFKGCDNLKDVSLKYNPMLFIEKESFSYLKGLQSLDLSSTGLSELPDTLFSNNTDLHYLILTANSFKAVPTQGLKSAVNLRMLDLSENPINKISSKAFFGSSNLEAIRLTHMRNLNTLEKYSLTGLENLRELYITDNLKLSKISERTFKAPPMFKLGPKEEKSDSEEDEDKEKKHPSLKKLYLRHNSLQSLPEDLLDWGELTELDLRENPWNCDCHLAWMAKDNIPKVTKHAATCSSPKRLTGRSQASLVESDYTCSYLSSDATIALSVLVVAAFVLALGGIGFVLYKRSLLRCGRKENQPRYTRVVATKDKVDLEWDHTGEPPTSQ